MVQVKTYETLPLNLEEICRYARCPVTDMPPFFYDCISESEKVLSYAVCYDFFTINKQINRLDLGFANVCSFDLAKNLEGCNRIILFAATAGIGIDLLIKKYLLLSPAKAVLFQAIGSAAAETVCDTFCKEIKKSAKKQKPRFSPGYGDLPLSLQTDIFNALAPQKHIGVTLGEGFIMTPSKSVTAIVGISE